MSSRQAAIAALLLGALTVCGFAPLRWFPAPLATLALLFVLWRNAATPGAAAGLGWLWGVGCFLGGVSWVFVSMHDVGGMPAAFAALATLALCAGLALYPALAGWLFARLRCGSMGRDALLAAGAWTAGEWLRGTLLTGFPWLSVGYSQSPPSPLAGYAAVLGVYGISLLVALLAALLAFCWRRIATSMIALAIFGGGAALQQVEWTQPVGAPLTVSLLQGNIAQDSKWNPQLVPNSLDTYARLARAHPAQLLVLPETALPMFLDDVPDAYLTELRANGPALFGVAVHAPDANRPDGYTNSAVTLSAEGRLQSYSKTHLVPFGEYVPPGFAWFLALMRVPMSDFSAGAAYQRPLEIAGQKIAANICYEDLFGEEILRALPEATLLINLSNTAWFGDSLAQPQHLQIAQMRAMETGRSMLRATNTGMTAAVRPDGRVIAELRPFAADALRVEVRGFGGLTPFSRWGNALALMLALGAALPALLRRRLTAASRGG